MRHRIRIKVKAFYFILLLTIVLCGYQNCSPYFEPADIDFGINSNTIYSCTQPENRGKGENRIRRLSSKEMRNTLKDLVGTQIYGDSTLQTILANIPEDSLYSVKDFSSLPPAIVTRTLIKVGERINAIFAGNNGLKATVLGECARNNPNANCITQLLNSFGMRVFRRPMTSQEIQAYVTFFNSSGGGNAGLEQLLLRLIQSPSMVFHVETGVSVEGSRIKLSNYEIASRISYQALSTMPDSQLFSSAANGELYDLSNVKFHVERLMQTSAAKERVYDLIKFYIGQSESYSPNAHAAAYENISIQGYEQEAWAELQDFVHHIVWTQKGTFADLMRSPASFPKSERFSKILNAPQVNNQNIVSNSNTHFGLLHRPAVLAASGERTSPIVRGAHIRIKFLCDNLGAPDPVAVAQQTEAVGDIHNFPNRDRVDLLTSATSCKGCHSLINNLGFAFENFSQLGSIRKSEPIFDSEGKLTKLWPIDTTGDRPLIDQSGPSRIANSTELVEYMAVSPKARACFSRSLMEFIKIRGQNIETDSCAISETEKNINQPIGTLWVNSIANKDIFWRSAD